jgi:hypothetical protein
MKFVKRMKIFVQIYGCRKNFSIRQTLMFLREESICNLKKKAANDLAELQIAFSCVRLFI